MCKPTENFFFLISNELETLNLEKCDIENMGIAVGIHFIGATELEINLGVIYLPPLDIQRCRQSQTLQGQLTIYDTKQMQCVDKI